MNRTRTQYIRICGIRADLLVVFLLVSLILGTYAQVKNFEFITYDDDLYVTANEQVKKGLTWEGIRWAYSLNDAVYWHPLTWISHMLDIEMYGLNPGMHHTTNLLFHVNNCILLFLIMFSMTGRLWRSAAVAGLFALHPLNVESVAWVAARKNLLSTFFWMLTILLYLQYCRKPNLLRYGICLVSFLLGLMSKPMLVTLPFALLLLDFWPLQRIRKPQWLDPDPYLMAKAQESAVTDNLRFSDRWRSAGLWDLVLEKMPMLLLAAITIYLYGASVKHLEIAVGLQAAPMTLRISNALVSYWVYIRQMFLPLQLTFLYPYPHQIPWWQSVGAGILLIVVTGAVLCWMRRLPYLFVGWSWYLGTLVPAIGLVQAGLWPATADRFVYVPMIGLFVALVWGTSETAIRWNINRIGLAAAVLALFVMLLTTTRRQVEFWQNNISLYEHAIAVTENNLLAHQNLGNAYLRSGKLKEAVHHHRACLRINPANSRAYNNLAAALVKMGKFDEAVSCFEKALQLDPGYVEAENNLRKTVVYRHLRSGKDLEERGNYQAAIEQYQEILSRYPEHPLAHYQIAVILGREGKVDEALVWLQRALQNGFRDWSAIQTSEHLKEVRKTAVYKKMRQEREMQPS